MASRRDLNQTDESAASLTPSTIEAALLSFRFIEASEHQNSHGVEILRRSLSVRSVVSTTSSFAELFEATASNPQLHIIREIGAGLQGTIFEQVGKPMVFKKEKIQNSLMACNLKNEFHLHQLVWDAFEKYRNHSSIHCDVVVPAAQKFIAAQDNNAWPTLLPKLPLDCRVQSDIVIMERVLPLPKIIRRALIEEFYPFPRGVSDSEKGQIIKWALNVVSNKDCLVRPYLGIPRKVYTEANFSLRNFIIGFEDLERCETDFETITQALGSAYAILHWAAHVNGDDVELVLGSSLATVPGRQQRFQQRKIGLFLIDYGQCDEVDMSKPAEEVYQAFRSAMVTGDNGCFIPNPRHRPQLFRLFKNTYSTTAKQILEESSFEKEKFDIDKFMKLYQEYVEDFL
ncbi:uncharacterized protein J7T54_005830 [Emericellopsis cladophorae]|uniref:DUF3669 domain-containing protein n=1 Tax=Emericellopsis cladophorae TaxID=2686198 RepID=A0A9P9XV06_9HYPO|nr:uncharacterized protein J7T54_005830 [Emericellopsis cladophorae]KAI6778314.1 hypothetical protein J7T54_005830 [Emericellopsis cladophorae]